MFRRLRFRRPSHATIVAYLALFVALGGSAYAAATIGSAQVIDNSLQSRDLRDNAAVRSQDVVNDNVTGGGLRSSDIRNNSLTSADVASLTGADVSDNSLTGKQINEETLGKVPDAQHAAVAGFAADADAASNADALDGRDSSDFFRSQLYTKTEGNPGQPGTDEGTDNGAGNEENPGPANGEGKEVVSCDSGDIAMSGGFQNGSSDARITHSYRTNPSFQSWVVMWQNGASPQNILAEVVCIDQQQ
jgi:hypothetical protein